MKTTVCFDKPITDFDGQPVVEGGQVMILGKVLANKIANAASERLVVKLYDWSQTMWKLKPLTLDSEDVANLKQFIELSLPNCPLFIKAQAIEAINAGKQE